MTAERPTARHREALAEADAEIVRLADALARLEVWAANTARFLEDILPDLEPDEDGLGPDVEAILTAYRLTTIRPEDAALVRAIIDPEHTP